MVTEGGQDTGDWEGSTGKSDGKVTESQGSDEEMRKSSRKMISWAVEKANKRKFTTIIRWFSKGRPNPGKKEKPKQWRLISRTNKNEKKKHLKNKVDKIRDKVKKTSIPSPSSLIDFGSETAKHCMVSYFCCAASCWSTAWRASPSAWGLTNIRQLKVWLFLLEESVLRWLTAWQRYKKREM